MSRLNRAQRKRWRELQGTQKALYRESILNGTAPQSELNRGNRRANRRNNPQRQVNQALNRVNANDPSSGVRADLAIANQQNIATAPNINTAQGSRQITYDENGRPVVNENLSQGMQQQYQGQVDFRNNTNQFVNQQMGQFQGFNPSPYQDPRSYNRSELESMYHANKNDMQNMSYNSNDMQRNANSMQQNRVPQFNEFDSYRQGVQNRAMNMYDRNTSADLNAQREQLRQELINSGNNVGSPLYEKEMNRFEQSSNNARLNAQDQAFLASGQEARGNYSSTLAGNQQGFNQGFQTNAQRFDQNYKTNDQSFNQQYATSFAPLDAAKSFLPYAGQYQQPNFGQVQQYSPYQPNVGGVLGGYYSSDNSRQASLGAAGISAGATTQAAGIAANSRIQAINAQAEQDRNNFAFQQGFGGGYV